ncbi:MAG: LPXTG cell wall anchor domain-containing protein [Candidatus Saccharibacteria bacterium]|nr:LPXTG cell wall anchor domain-containing protein [Candidatus Saccharibacteria bacterium]
MSTDRKTGEQSNGWMALGVAGAFVLGMGLAVNYA